ncbi:MAG: fibronectin type III domain-containing protein, partial [Saprospiraceae bacterium]
MGYYSAPYPIEMIAQDPVIPVINDVNYDGEFLTVACTADGYPLGVLQVVSGAGQIIHMTPPTPIQQIVIPVQLADTVSYSIKIKVCIDNYDLTQFGDWSDSVNLITQAPRVESVGYEKNDSNEWKLQTIFQKTGYAADYEVSIYLDDLLVEIPDEAIGMSIISGLDIVECVIIYPLDATKVYQLRIRGINRYNRTLIGPYSEAIELITAAPVITTVRYDDYNEMLGVAWKPCLQSTITGYQVILYENGSSDSLHAATNDSTEFYASLKKDEEYTVTVKAISNKATGPQSSSVNPVDTEAVFNVLLSYDDLMIRRSDTKRNTNFQLQLQQLFKAPPSDLTILANPNDPKSPFVLTQTDGAYFEYYLDVGENSNVWENPVDNEKIRGALQTNYIDFLTTLEQVSGGLVPGTIPYLQQIIGRGFQLTFDESLYYAYGFDANNRYCDLRAGMRVRIDYEQYQFAGPNSSELQNGMVGNGTSYYDINAYLSNEDPTTQVLNLGFDAFLSQLNFTIPELRGGGAGMLDTYFASMRKPYLRIFYPQNFGTPNGAGEANALKNIALVAANTFTQMENATQLFITSGVAAFPPDVEVMYFRGRVAIIPEIQVNVNQQSLYVPVGTTLRQLLQRFINLPSRHAGPKIYLNFTFTRGTENVALQGETELVLPHNLALNLNNLFQDTYLSINQ